MRKSKRNLRIIGVPHITRTGHLQDGNRKLFVTAFQEKAKVHFKLSTYNKIVFNPAFYVAPTSSS
jgi:hypothetical protein